MAAKLIKFNLICLLLLILVAPTYYKIEKVFFIIFLLLVVFMVLVKSTRKIEIDKKVFIWFLIYMCANAFFLFLGVIKSEQVFFQLLPSKIIWPTIYFFIFVCALSVKSHHVNYDKILFFAAVVIPVFILLTFYFDNIPYISVFFKYTKKFYAGFVDYFSPAITSLFFLGGYSIIRTINVNRKKDFLFLIPSILILWCSVIIGRRALIALIVCSPIVFLIIQIFYKKIKQRQIVNIVLLLFVIAISVFIVIKNSTIELRIFEVARGNEVFQSNVRWLQFESLINGWKENPLIGSGLGINAEISRSTIYLGAYELSYVAMLFQTGLVGSIIYISLYIWLLFSLGKIYNATNNTIIASFLVGAILVFIANASNPYIDSFDGLWFIFLSLAIINRFKVVGLT